MILNVQLINFLPLSHHFTVLMLQTSNGLLQTCRDVSFFVRGQGRPKRYEGRPFRGLCSRPILSLFLFESRLSMSSRTWRSSPPEMVRKYGRSPGSLVNPKIVCKWMFILRNRLLYAIIGVLTHPIWEWFTHLHWFMHIHEPMFQIYSKRLVVSTRPKYEKHNA